MERNYKWTEVDEARFLEWMSECKSTLEQHSKYLAWCREMDRDPDDSMSMVDYKADPFWQTEGRVG